MVTLKAEFSSDWTGILRNALGRMGYTIPASMDAQTVAVTFFSVSKRRVEPARRKVFQSQEFTCPIEHAKGLDALKQAFESGADVSLHMSKRLDEPLYKDMLLNDWGVHHFHLGDGLDTDGFIKRTGPVLFARVTEDSVFMIDVKGHPESRLC